MIYGNLANDNEIRISTAKLEQKFEVTLENADAKIGAIFGLDASRFAKAIVDRGGGYDDFVYDSNLVKITGRLFSVETIIAEYSHVGPIESVSDTIIIEDKDTAETALKRVAFTRPSEVVLEETSVCAYYKAHLLRALLDANQHVAAYKGIDDNIKSLGSRPVLISRMAESMTYCVGSDIYCYIPTSVLDNRGIYTRIRNEDMPGPLKERIDYFGTDRAIREILGIPEGFNEEINEMVSKTAQAGVQSWSSSELIIVRITGNNVTTRFSEEEVSFLYTDRHQLSWVVTDFMRYLNLKNITPDTGFVAKIRELMTRINSLNPNRNDSRFEIKSADAPRDIGDILQRMQGISYNDAFKQLSILRSVDPLTSNYDVKCVNSDSASTSVLAMRMESLSPILYYGRGTFNGSKSKLLLELDGKTYEWTALDKYAETINELMLTDEVTDHWERFQNSLDLMLLVGASTTIEDVSMDGDQYEFSINTRMISKLTNPNLYSGYMKIYGNPHA